ncbi:MAG: phosphate ABC transporter permease subunit PstC [Candidatus Binatia bacterium]
MEKVLIGISARPFRRTCMYFRESLIEALLFLAALSSIGITAWIIFILVSESYHFFGQVSLLAFFTDTQWTPLYLNAHYGILPLVSGTVVIAAIALLIALPLGSVIAIYLSEYASRRVRETVKPVLELLSAVPTVVFGYFALLFVTPMLQRLFPTLPGFNMLSAGIVIGIMITPYVSSMSEDAMQAVPMYVREASYALGSTRLQTATRVVYPSAFSGITSAYVLAFSRAIGETMVVSIAAGMRPNLTWSPMEQAQTLTGYIVQVSLGDLPYGTIGYQTIFAAGLTLFMMTLAFNITGHLLRKRYRDIY